MIDFGEFTAIVFLLLAEILYFLNRLVAFRHFVVLEPIVSSMILTSLYMYVNEREGETARERSRGEND